jgi:hypothetical protein
MNPPIRAPAIVTPATTISAVCRGKAVSRTTTTPSKIALAASPLTPPTTWIALRLLTALTLRLLAIYRA